MSYYYIQTAKNKQVIKKDKTFKGAIALARLLLEKYNCEIIATEIHDCHHNKVKLYDGEELYKVMDEVGNYVELNGGRWIKGCGDGRYYLTGDDNIMFAGVSINCYNVNGDFISGESIGYVQV